MNDSYDRCRSLYRTARPYERSSQVDRRAVRTAIAAAVTTGAPAAAAGASAASLGASSAYAGAGVASAKGVFHVLLGGKLLSGVLIGTLLGTAVSTTVYVALPTPQSREATTVQRNPSSPIERSPPKAAQPEPVANVQPSSASRVEASDTTTPETSNLAVFRERPLSTPRRPAHDRSMVTSSTGSHSHDRLTEETQGLAKIQDALSRKDPKLAWALLEEQDRQFPSGQLAQERAAAKVMALCAAHRFVEAERARSSFLTAHPRSPLTQRVGKGCDQ